MSELNKFFEKVAVHQEMEKEARLGGIAGPVAATALGLGAAQHLGNDVALRYSDHQAAQRAYNATAPAMDAAHYTRLLDSAANSRNSIETMARYPANKALQTAIDQHSKSPRNYLGQKTLPSESLAYALLPGSVSEARQSPRVLAAREAAQLQAQALRAEQVRGAGLQRGLNSFDSARARAAAYQKLNRR